MALTEALIDDTYFVGDIRLALTQNSNALNELIQSKQEDYLRTVLGEVEALNFINDLVANVPQTQKWIDFLNGKTLTVVNKNGESKDVEYKGFKNLLAYFMYYEYIVSQNSKQTQNGATQQDIANSTRISPVSDISYIYTKTIRQFYGLDWMILHSNYNAENYGVNRYNVPWLTNNYHSFDYWSYSNKYYGKINSRAERIKGTVYNYLYYTNVSDSTSFPDWDFTHIETQAVNIFNL